ncbi:CPBP family intramembrane glutamic endopeptidase [Leptospira sanjuanensis]|uniref:CPBP family intramembrane glutamic endopeptidase n=1 Tax=Leptospira sanjuanensis TaxID=2879643 RepID=UPI001EE875B7|nr:CPBP family intramembrane glutamic endopeptidase [Leptospira sanjuanensis]MCG6169619.1 CPBP family intramembrane metalloprotease [Leptospira sanjuanensis]
MEILSILKGFFRKNRTIYALLFGVYGSLFLLLFLNEEFGFPLLGAKNPVLKTIATLCIYGMLMVFFYFHISPKRRNRFAKRKLAGFLFVFWICMIVLEFLDLSHEKFLMYLPREWIYWSWKVAKQFVHFVPLLAIPLLYDFYRHKTDPVPFEKKKNPRYYPILILGLLIAAIGSLVPGFREFYPRAPLSNEQLLYHATWFTTLGFEIVYLSTFYFTEFFFRKFIIRYLSFAGRYHAVGMGALIYGMVHFEKPRGEILSSFFGGLLMGALSIRTHSIRGGLYAHIALAAGMEFFAGIYVWEKLF